MTGPVRIGIDGFNLAMPRGTGIATYARVLSRTLSAMGHEVDVLYGLPLTGGSPLMREVGFFDRLETDTARKSPSVWSRRFWRERRRVARGMDAFEVPMAGVVDRRAFRMPAFDRVLNAPDLYALAARHFRARKRFMTVRIPDPPAIMHWTYPLPIRLEGARNIYTIHDLVPVRLPHTTLDDKGMHLHLIRGCIAAGERICTVSETSRADIERLFPESVGRVTNTYESVDAPDAPPPAPDELAGFLSGVFGLRPRGYFLFFGSIEPKKNIGRLIEAYLASGSAAPLIIVGAQVWKAERELGLIRMRDALDLPKSNGPQIRQIEYLPFSILLNLVRGARAVLFPSLYEGFGLPVVEAMAQGTATLTSTEGAMPEIAGDASLLVDPYDTAALAQAIRRLDTDDALRARLEQAGPARAARFGAGPYRQALAGLYADVLGTAAGARLSADPPAAPAIGAAEPAVPAATARA